MRQGRFYGVGVGPGDPELLTLKAIKTIRECEVLAIPVSDTALKEPSLGTESENDVQEKYLEQCVAYQIVKEAIEGMEEKEKIFLPMPMMKEKEQLRAIHDACAKKTAELLDKGKNVAFITLGDPSIYSTCLYIHERMGKMGYDTQLIPGVPSFCAVAARMNTGLVKNREELHIIPASYEVEESLTYPGTKVLMKTGKKMPYIKRLASENNWNVQMIENCGMPGEKQYDTIEEIPEKASYYSLLIVKEEKE